MGYIEAAELIVSAIAGAYSVTASQDAAAQQQAAYRARLTQQRLQTVDKESKQQQVLQQTLGRQAAMEAGRGVSLASPSFKTIQRKSYENYNDDKEANAMNMTFAQQETDAQIGASQAKADAEKFQVISSFASSAFSQYNFNSTGNSVSSGASTGAKSAGASKGSAGVDLPIPFE